MKSFRREYFVFLLPLFFVLHGFAEHYASIPVQTVLSLFLQYELLTLVALVIFWPILKSIRKASLLAFFLLCLYFFFGALHDGLKGWSGDGFISSYSFILPVLLLISVGVIIWVKRSNHSFHRVVNYLNLVLLILIFWDGFSLITRLNREPEEWKKGLKECSSCDKPDIYLIISDGYAGRTQLEKVFRFDNSAFEDSLKALGFHIVDSSTSNYSGTVFSVSSLLNMDYNLKTGKEETHELTWKTRLVSYLISLGYVVRNLSFFRIEDQFPAAAIRYFPTGKELISAHTFLSRLERDLRHNISSRLGIRSELEKMENLKKQQAKEALQRDRTVMEALLAEARTKHHRPRFIYSHFIMPHAPYLFRKDGSLMREGLSEKDQYIEYLQYTNGFILQTLRRILGSSSRPPVILFMSDHGYRNDNDPVMDPFRFSNINAVFLPGKDYQPFYKGLSNVNLFRILLNILFKNELQLLKDRIVF